MAAPRDNAPRETAPRDMRTPAAPLRVLTRAAARRVDELAVEEFGIPSIVLMENAAIGAVAHVLELARARNATAVLAVCGPGNNGGDGFTVVRHAVNAGLRAACVAAFAGEGSKDAAINRRICERMGVTVKRGVSADGRDGRADDIAAEHATLETAAMIAGADAGALVVIDAVFGTGLDRAPHGAGAGAIRGINRLRAMGAGVIALDVPSGVDAQSGAIFDPAVVADRTVTFAAAKPGMIRLDTQEHIGDLHIVGIGAPESLIDRLSSRVPPHRDAAGDEEDLENGSVPVQTERFGRREAAGGPTAGRA